MSQKQTSKRRVATGWLLIVGLIVVGIIILGISDITEATRDTVDLATTFSEADRLRPGTPVWIAGHEVGEVTDVDFLPPGQPGEERIVAIVRIPAEGMALLRRDSRSRLISPQPLGPPVVELLAGSAEAPPARPGDTLREQETTGLEQAIERGRSTTEDLDTLGTALRSLGELLDRRRETFGGLGRPARGTALEMGEVATNLRTGAARGVLADEDPRVRVRQLLGTVGELRVAVDSVITAVGGASGAAADTRAAVRDRLEMIQAELDRLSRAIDAAEGTAGRVARDPAITDALEGVRIQADSLAAELRSNPFRIF